MVQRRHFLCVLALSLALASQHLFDAQGAARTPRFESVSPDVSGIRWIHDNAMSDNRFLPETTGAGCAFLDYDNDGWMDIFLVNSGSSDFFRPTKPLHYALYRNNRDGTFTDVTARAGIDSDIFGMGVAVGDYDNDGFPDIFLSGAGRSILYRNNGDGTFNDATNKAGISVSGWAVSSVWFDYDGDGRLDLFVGRYIAWDPEVRHSCGANAAGRHYYCTPQAFPSTTSLLFHNNGNGTFTETGADTPIGAAMGKALGVVATDINNDGRMDLFVSNDTVRNFLFVNRGPDKSGKVRWEESGNRAEVSYSEDGKERSGMGVDSADFNRDGWQDLFVSNIDHESFSLYENRGDGTFRDRANSESIGRVTRLLSGWGMKFFDFDNDSEIDLILANGHPNDMIAKYSPVVTYRQPLRLLRRIDGHYQDVSADAGPVFSESYSARGLALGDYDNDGRIDVLVQINGGRPLLLRNRSGEGNHWLGIALQGIKANRDAVGAIVRWSVNGKTSSRLKIAGGSFLSSHDPRMVLGLGAEKTVDWLEVQWPQPSGLVQRIASPPVDRYITVVEGRPL
jgi:hypothetical protein